MSKVFGADAIPIIYIADISKYEKTPDSNIPLFLDFISDDIATLKEPKIVFTKSKKTKLGKNTTKNKTCEKSVDKWNTIEERKVKKKKKNYQKSILDIEETVASVHNSSLKGSSTTSLESYNPINSNDNVRTTSNLPKSVQSDSHAQNTNMEKTGAIKKRVEKENIKKRTKKSKSETTASQALSLESKQLTAKDVAKRNKQTQKVADELLTVKGVPKVNKLKQSKANDEIDKTNTKLNTNGPRTSVSNILSKEPIIISQQMKITNIDHSEKRSSKRTRRNVLKSLDNGLKNTLNACFTEKKVNEKSSVKNKRTAASKTVKHKKKLKPAAVKENLGDNNMPLDPETCFAECLNRTVRSAIQREELLEQCSLLLEQYKPSPKNSKRRTRTLLSESMINSMEID